MRTGNGTTGRVFLAIVAGCLCILLTSGAPSEAAVAATPVFSPDAQAIAGLTRVTISCPTPGATIRYTTNGTTPTTSNGTVIASGASVYILPATTLKARAWAAGQTESNVKSATYTARAVNKPYYIAHGTAAVDGDISEWADAEWTPLTELYDVPRYPGGAPLNPGTPDIVEASYATRWSTDRVYVAVKVRDTAHHLIDDYLGWDSSDLVEYCIHTTGTGPTDYNNYGFAAAQEFVVGIRPDGASVWASLGPTGSAAGTGIDVAGREVGEWFFYEAAIVPYQILNVTNPSLSVISYLSAGDVIGLDPLVLANDGVTSINTANSVGYTGMRTENMMTGKFMNYNAIGRHLLVKGGSVAGVKACDDGEVVSCPGIVTAVFGDVFYVEASDRSRGIRVRKSGHGMSVGYAAQVIGVAATDSATGERYVDAGPGMVSGAYRKVLAPLAMTGKSLAVAGADSSGLYVRTAGRVAAKWFGWFMLDDGSGVAVKIVGAVPSGTPCVVVTGVSSCEKDAGGTIQRKILATSIVEAAP